MSYDLDILARKVSSDDALAWAELERAGEAQGEPPAVLRELHDRLTARFPCISTLSDEAADGPDSVWASGPLWSDFGAEVARLALQFPKVASALPFVIETANGLGLVVFDWQARRIHRGDGVFGLTLTFEGEELIFAPTPEEIDAAVDSLSPEGAPGFVILERSAGTYAQVAGGEGFVAEWRETTEDGSFRHFAAGEPGVAADETVEVIGNGQFYAVPANERLGASEARALLRAFALDGSRPAFYAWRDMTADFLPKPKKRAWWKFWA